MQMQRLFLFLVFAGAAPAWAQSSSQPLNLQVPADAATPPAAAEPAKDSEPGNSAAPGAQDSLPMPLTYEETYGMRRDAAERACDDKTYGQPQIHGSVGMGVGSGRHESGNYQAATIAMTKALGSCDDPKGLVGASISVGQGNSNFHHGGRP